MTQRYYRRVIKITAEDSPNVRFGVLQTKLGQQVTDEALIPGVLSYREYLKRRETWDPIRQTISLDATWYEGRDVLLFPPEWLTRAEHPDYVAACRRMPAEAIGVDSGEGVANTALAAVNRYGLKELVSQRTPDTSVVPDMVINFMHRHQVVPERVAFDAGGGGKQHAHVVRRRGYKGVRVVAFGESLILDPKRGLRILEEKKEHKEEHYIYRNRRAQMYGELRLLIDPARTDDGGRPLPFALPPDYPELRRQLAPIPLTYDGEGRLELLPKRRRAMDQVKDPLGGQGEIKSLIDIIGCSPDEADAVALACFAMLHRQRRPVAGPAT